MINRAHRFHGFNALRHVYARGRTMRGPLMAIRFIVNDRRTSYRAAVVVSRKTNKSAVVRNRIRRRLYEALRRHEAQIQGSYDIVITVFNDQVAVMDGAKLEQELTGQLTKAGIISPAASAPHSQASRTSRAIVVPKEK